MSAKRDRAWGRIPSAWRDDVIAALKVPVDVAEKLAGDCGDGGIYYRVRAESYRAAIRVLERAARKRRPATARARGK